MVPIFGVWVGFGWRLGGVWVGVRWLDLGPVVVIFFLWVGGFVPMGLMVGFGVCWVCLGRG